MVTDGHFKFVQRLNGKHELYCLDQDPYEEKNLYETEEKDAKGMFTDPALRKVMERMQAELLRWYQETCDVVPRAYDSRFSEEWMWKFLRNIVPGEMEQTVREYTERSIRYSNSHAIRGRHSRETEMKDTGRDRESA